MVDLNQQLVASGTEEAMNSVIERFKRGEVDFVFSGDYSGTDPEDPSDTIDLRSAYIENANTSYPMFHYILSDIITIEK